MIYKTLVVKKKGDVIQWITSPSLKYFQLCNYASVAGTTETYLLSSLPTLKLTVPSTKAKECGLYPFRCFHPDGIQYLFDER